MNADYCPNSLDGRHNVVTDAKALAGSHPFCLACGDDREAVAVFEVAQPASQLFAEELAA